MSLINIMEKLVDARIAEKLPGSSCCNCEQCVDDIKAIALNKLPPKYVSTQKGELFSRLDSIMEKQNKLDIDIAVLSAIEFVAAHPHHDVNHDINKE